MNKTAKGILIGAGVLVLLSGALVALKLTEPDSGTASGSSLSSQEDHSTLLWELDEKDIKSVAVTFGTEVDFQRGHNVALVVADQNVVHVSVLRIQEYHSRI